MFCHPALGTPLDPSKLTGYSRKAIKQAGVTKPFRPWHGLRHTALTETAAAGVPAMFVQAKAGHAQGSTTERYLHAAKTSYPDMAELAEARMFPSGSWKEGWAASNANPQSWLIRCRYPTACFHGPRDGAVQPWATAFDGGPPRRWSFY